MSEWKVGSNRDLFHHLKPNCEFFRTYCNYLMNVCVNLLTCQEFRGVRMPKMHGKGLSRREREIVEILHRLGRASVQDVCDAMDNPPSYSSVRTTLGILVEKGIALHHEDGKRYLYTAAESSQDAAKSAVNKLVDTFFGGRFEGVVRTFLSDKESNMTDEELDQLVRLINESKKGQSK